MNINIEQLDHMIDMCEEGLDFPEKALAILDRLQTELILIRIGDDENERS